MGTLNVVNFDKSFRSDLQVGNFQERLCG